ncbi:MAG: DUF3788 domain-containing protein [Oscillospiraceae bacterium]|jgi:AraC family transcriptional regulator|nr:DUF3788 domain-containing protein [Oscillospiraceae bacterium]
MQWYDLFDKEHEPTVSEVSEFIAAPLWSELADYMRQTYNAEPNLSYSSCAMDGGIWKGWNVKYKKSGKSLCTLYPKQGYFLLLIAVSVKDIPEADLLAPLFGDYVKNLYNTAEVGKNYGKMLGLEVTDEEILRDVKKLIELRVRPRNKK